jgi:hypothetical protein
MRTAIKGGAALAATVTALWLTAPEAVAPEHDRPSISATVSVLAGGETLGDLEPSARATIARFGLDLDDADPAVETPSDDGDPVYLVQSGQSTFCIIRPAAGGASCGASGDVGAGGVYLMTGNPGGISAVIVVPDGIESVRNADQVGHVTNNLGFIKLLTSDSTVLLAGPAGEFTVDVGYLSPPG